MVPTILELGGIIVNNLTKELLSKDLMFAIVIGIQAAVAGVNNRLIGTKDQEIKAIK